MDTKSSTNVRRITVADDNVAIVDAMKIILEDEGYDVTTIIDGTEVFEKVKTTPPDLLLLDIWMSGENGGKICKRLKEINATRKLPIVLVSANKDTQQLAEEAGADGFILKPFDLDDLLVKVKELVD